MVRIVVGDQYVLAREGERQTPEPPPREARHPKKIVFGEFLEQVVLQAPNPVTGHRADTCPVGGHGNDPAGLQVVAVGV